MSDKKFTLSDLKTAQVESNMSLSDFSEELCYHRGINVLFRPLKIKDKKDLLKSIESKDEVTINKNLDRIIEKYVSFDNNKITADDLTLQERYQILTYIRRAAAGDTVKIVHRCPRCEEVVTDIDYDLSNMEVKYYEPNAAVENTIKIGDKITLVLGPLSRKDEKDLEILIKKKKAKTDTEKQIISLVGIIKDIQLCEDDILGIVDISLEQKFDFFEDLDQSVIGKLVEFMKHIECGVRLPFSFNCPKCEYENDDEEASVAAFFIS